MKTNAVRMLDRAGLNYTLRTYDWDEDSLNAMVVAQKIGIEVQRMFKTLVLQGTHLPHFVVVIPGDVQLDLKNAARQTGNKSCNMLPLKQLQSLTGYLHGGCSPLGMKKPLACFIDKRALEHEEISISGGKRGLQILMAPRDLAQAVPAEFREF